jgi:NAD(P)-dependent dehydrogenase (short-subunit alcohol dehydrogenase family)
MIEFITPLNRMGNAEDVANMVEFLCSEKSSFITGQAFWVDGGLSIRSQESIAREYISTRTTNQR